MLYLHGDNIEDEEKQGIVTNIEFEAMIISIKKKFLHKCMVGFADKLELYDKI